MKSHALSMLTILILLGLGWTGCGGSEGQAESASPEARPPLVGNAATGREVFMETCFTCHGEDASGIEGSGTDLTRSEFIRSKTHEELIEYIKAGREINDPLNTTGMAMPPYGANPALSDQDLADVVTYLKDLQQGP